MEEHLDLDLDCRSRGRVFDLYKLGHVRVGEAEGDPEGDGRRTLANGWESRLWRLEDKHLREGSSVRQFGRPRPLSLRHRRRRR